MGGQYVQDAPDPAGRVFSTGNDVFLQTAFPHGSQSISIVRRRMLPSDLEIEFKRNSLFLRYSQAEIVEYNFNTIE